MNRDLLDIICCPVCKQDLELEVQEEEDEIIVGNLYCDDCDENYPIQDGIPNLLPPDMRDA